MHIQEEPKSAKLPELQDLHERLQMVNERSTRIIGEIKEKLNRIYSVPTSSAGRMGNAGSIDKQESNALNSLRAIINHTHENADQLEDILNHLNQII